MNHENQCRRLYFHGVGAAGFLGPNRILKSPEKAGPLWDVVECAKTGDPYIFLPPASAAHSKSRLSSLPKWMWVTLQSARVECLCLI